MKIALVTGSTSGIGYEISKRLLKMNYIVYAIGRNFIKNNENIFNEYENFIVRINKTLFSLTCTIISELVYDMFLRLQSAFIAFYCCFVNR